MVKRAKLLLMFAGIIVLTTITFFWLGNKNKPNKEEMENWLAVKPVPFAGYICGYEDTKTLIQLPIFLPEGNTVTLDNAATIQLCGKDKALDCSGYRLSDFINYEDTDYKSAMLSFQVHLSKEGDDIYNYLSIILQDGTRINWELGDINVVVSGQMGEEELSVREFWGKQDEADRFAISYANNTDGDITITDFSYPKQIYDRISIQRYNEFDLMELEEGSIISSGEEKTFLISMEKNDVYNEVEEFYFYMLPFVYYVVNGEEKKMPGQTQAAICQPPFTKEFVLGLMEGSK